MNIQEMIEEKSKELALLHAGIMEMECKKACEKYNCNPEDLIIEYHDNAHIKIKLCVSDFTIENQFICNGEIIK